MFQSIGGRKFAFAMALMLCFGAFVLVDKMSVDQFMSGSLLAMSVFTVGNVAGKIMKK